MIKFNDFPNSDEKGGRPVEFCFERAGDTDKRILTLLIVSYQPINKTYLPRCHTTPAGFAMPTRMICQWITIVYSLLTEVEISVKTAEGELAANQDDERCWIIVSNKGYGSATNRPPVKIGVSLRSLDGYSLDI